MDGEKYTDIDLTVVGEVSDDAFEDFVTLFEEWTEKHGVSPLIAAVHPMPDNDESYHQLKQKVERVRALLAQARANGDGAVEAELLEFSLQ